MLKYCIYVCPIIIHLYTDFHVIFCSVLNYTGVKMVLTVITSLSGLQKLENWIASLGLIILSLNND